jgi:PAS domain S-box-containing protein
MRNTRTVDRNRAEDESLSGLAETHTGAGHEQFGGLLPALLSCSQSVFYIVQDRKFQVVTEQLLSETGLSQEELLGRDPLSIVHPDDRAKVRENAVKMLKGERSAPYEFRFVDSSGNTKYVREAVTSITYKGKPATLGNWIDLTESRQIEEELRVSEEFNSDILQNAPNPVLVINPDSSVRFINPAFERLTGFTQADTIGQKSPYPWWPEAEREACDTALQDALAGISNRTERINLKKNGESFWAVMTSTPVMKNGALRYLLVNWVDVTERRQAEDALRQSEEFSSSLMRNSAVSILVVNDDTSIRYVTPAFEKLTGFTAEEVIGKVAPYAWWLGEKSSGDINELKRDVHTGVRRLEKHFQKKNGEQFWVEITSAPVKRNGEFQYSLENWLDITEQKRSLQAIKESEEKFATAFQSSPNPVFITSLKNGKFIEINDSFSRITGYTKEEITGRTARNIKLWADARDSERITPVLRKHGRVTDEEITFRTKTGEIRHGIYSAEIIKLSGDDCVLTTINDITEHKMMEKKLRESEEKYRAIFEQASDSIVLINAETEALVDFNDRAHQNLGYTREELAKLKVTDIDVVESHEETVQHLKKTYGGETEVFETKHRTKDGNIKDIQVSIKMLNIGGKIFSLAVWHDITERMMMEDELRTHRDHLEELVQQRTTQLESLNSQLEKELAERKRIEEELLTAINNANEANRAKSDFLARMSHEIRTPIHGVMGTLDLLRDTELGQEQRQYVSMAKTSAEALLNVINDILDFSKIEAGKIDLENRDFNLRTVLEETLETVAVPAHKKGLEILRQVSRNVPTTLIGDAGRLRQVLVNLLGNAVKFTEQGEIVLRVDVEAESEKVAELHFSVRDTGIGIPKEKQELLFHPFEQVDGSTTRKYGGSGLGLAICQQLVSIMSGRIWFTSWPGEGSTFHFTAKFGKQAAGEPANGLPEIPSELRGLPLLLVSNNATGRSILRNLLSGWGFQVTEADNGRAALKELEDARGTSRQFHIVLLDKTVPIINGGTVVEEMLCDPSLRSGVVMMLPSHNISDDFAWCQELGISHALIKPVKESELLDIILKALGHAETAEEANEPAMPLPPDTPQLCILVAEDNITSQLIARKTLEKAGHTVQIAGTGVEAIRMVKEGNYDLVLMDVEMPEMNGLEATQFIRKTEKESGQHIPIIAMTAYAMKEDRQRCLQAGMDAYLSKPVKPDELYSIIRGFSFGKEARSEVMDVGAALKLVGDDEDILREVVGVFLEQDYPEQLKRLKDGIGQHDAQVVKAAAHSIKGAARSFGSAALSRTALWLEEMGRNGDLAGAEAALQELEQEAGHFADFFARYTSQGSNQ